MRWNGSGCFSPAKLMVMSPSSDTGAGITQEPVLVDRAPDVIGDGYAAKLVRADRSPAALHEGELRADGPLFLHLDYQMASRGEQVGRLDGCAEALGKRVLRADTNRSHVGVERIGPDVGVGHERTLLDTAHIWQHALPTVMLNNH